MFVSLTALTAHEIFDGQGAVRPCSLPLVFAAYAYLAASAEKEQEASWSAPSPLLFMQLSRPSFCESYERRIFETTGGQQRPRFGSLAFVVTI